MENLTRQEEEVMLRIWQHAPCFIREVLDGYTDPMPYTTLASIFKNLERKKYIKGKRMGICYQYHVLIDQESYKRAHMEFIASNYFGNSYKQMVSFFAKEQRISADDLKELAAMIEQGKE
ncbi:MAG: BlaI/MecI/CopY family transcriptional regulator [Parabacteroides sp.]